MWHPEAGHLYRDIIFDHIFYAIIHLGQITNFDSLGHPRGQKGSEVAHFSKSIPPPPTTLQKKLQIYAEKNFSSEIW